jgi:sec-independent protein translocase protein TatA
VRFGPWEIALIIIVIFLLFGAKKIPDIMKGFGTGIKEFKKGLHEGDEPPPADNSKKPPDSIKPG